MQDTVFCIHSIGIKCCPLRFTRPDGVYGLIHFVAAFHAFA